MNFVNKKAAMRSSLGHCRDSETEYLVYKRATMTKVSEYKWGAALQCNPTVMV